MIVAGRYAKALIDIAIEKNQLEEVNNDMLLVNNIYTENKELAAFVKSPIINAEKKAAILNSIFQGKVSAITASFLNLMVTKNREDILLEITKAFSSQYKALKNITSAHVYSAIPLDDSSKKKIELLAKKQVTGEIELEERIDSSLIGGFVLKINDTQIDQSVKRKLADLKKQFSNNEYLPNIN
jgi:F-type H+-transporting ATPase subunit delta